MMITYFIIFFFIYSININPVISIGCEVCERGGYFVAQNGYRCSEQSDNEVTCTCPDQKHATTNRPCRICQRDGICGPMSARCSEESTSFDPNNKTARFACFCSSGLYKIGEKCPDDPSTTMPLTISTQDISTTSILITTSIYEITNDANTTYETTTNPFTTDASTGKISTVSATTETLVTSVATATTGIPVTTTTTTSKPCSCPSCSSHLIINTILIILLNLVYFVNK